MKNKTAVVLFNLGGPSDLDSVRGFLFNLFSDKAIINLPFIFRIPLASFISRRREKFAKEIYSLIGGKSPILENTKMQAQELQKKIGNNYKVFVCMRCSSPNSKEVFQEVSEYDPDEILLIPLYPQLSTTTSVSSIEDFTKKFKDTSKIKSICCYPTEKGFIDSNVNLINNKIKNLHPSKYRILFTAHGLPEKIIKSGDPYQWQVEQTAKAIVDGIKVKDLDYVICYQSKVGPLKWITPSTEDEIVKASKDNKILVLVPLSFVSEHCETLVELDIEYKELAQEHNCVDYIRIPTVSMETDFIDSLVKIVKGLERTKKNSPNSLLITNLDNKRYCPKNFCKCLYDGGKVG